MPLASRNTNKLETLKKPISSIKQTPKLRKRKVTATSIKRDQHQITQTKSDSALTKQNKIDNEVNKKQSRRENAREKAQDELVSMIGSKIEGSNEFDEKLAGYVKMFGKPEMPQENSNIRENIRYLLINKKNEIDIERLMALHLLSLRPAKNCFRLQFTEARLQENDRQLTRYSEILPHYIIVSDDLKHCDCFSDKNRKSIKSTFLHLSINRQVEELLNATIEAIRKSNPSKLEMLWLQAFDTNNVKKLMAKEKFRYLLTSMKYNLKWLLGDSADKKTEICELRDVTFYRVNKDRDYQANTVFKIELPKFIYKEIMFDDRTKYHMRIADIGLRMVRGQRYLLHEDGLCIFQKPTNPAGIIVIAENGQFISLINGPDFNAEKNIDIKFNNIALYVLFHSDIKDHSKDWEEIQKMERTKRKDIDEIKKEISNEKLNEVARKKIMKRMLRSLRKEENLIFSSKYANARKLAKLNKDNVVLKFAQILKDVISINRIVRLLSEFTLKERELAMTSSNYGGLGFSRIIIGKNTMQLIKELCGRSAAQLQVTPMHNTNVLDRELSKVSLNIPENIDEISQELYNFEHSKANRFLLTEFETNKIKQFVL